MNHIKIIVLILFLIIFCYKFYFQTFRSYYVNLKLKRGGDPEMFLYELEKDITKAKSDEYRRSLLVNKVSGLFYMGKWEECIDLLDRIGSNFDNEIYTVVYYVNYITVCIFLGNIDTAKRLYLDNKELFEKYKTVSRYKDVTESLKKIEGIFCFYDNDLNRSKSIFEELLDKQKSSIYNAINHYFLGKILEKEGSFTESKIHFNKAKALGNKTFLSNQLS